MAQTINADDGVISGSAGLKSSSDGTAVLTLQTKGTNALTVDGSQNVGIGTTSPAAQLHVVGSDTTDQVIIENTDAGVSTAPDLVLYRNSASPAASDILGYLVFRGKDSAGNTEDYGSIYTTITSATSGSEGGALVFETNNAGSNTEKLRLDSAGNLGLGAAVQGSWGSGSTALQLGKSTTDKGSISTEEISGDDYLSVSRYCYFDNTNWKRIGGGNPTRYYQRNGTHGWQTAASGADNSTITWTDAALLDASGNLGIGSTSPGNPLTINKNGVQLGATSAYLVSLHRDSTPNKGISLGYDSGSQTGIVLSASNADASNLAFWTYSGSAWGERARITSGGEFLVGTTTANSTTGITLRGDGVIVAKGVYNTLVSSNTRDIYMDDSGYFGYISSTRNSKTNINSLNDVDWLHQLNPVLFNYKKLDRETNERTDEPEAEKQYGLIAEEVESVNADICFYDVVDGNRELRGVNYSKLIAPLLKLAQQQQARIEQLESKVAALEGA